MTDNIEDKSIADEDAITRYLKGQMSAEEEKAFMAELNSNSELKSKAIAIARMVKAMETVGKEKDENVIKAIKDMGRETSNSKMPENFFPSMAAHRVSQRKESKILFMPKKTFMSVAAAASILVCIFGGYRIYDNNQMSNLGGEYLAYFPASEYTRGENDETSSIINKLYRDVEDSHALPETIAQLNRLWEESRSDTFNDFTEYSPEIGWILANAYVKDNNKADAIRILSVLIDESEPESALSKKSTELRTKIEQRKIF